jgi:hypothetical protein
MAVALAVLVAGRVDAQVQSGRVYRVATYKAHTDRAGDYSEAYRDLARPVYDEMVRRGSIVSYRLLVKDSGSGDSTHMIIIEFADWASVGQFDQNIDAAATSALRRPWSSVQEVVIPMRELISSDLYEGPPSD